MWVLVLNALAPLAAQAVVARQQDGHGLEICTSTGMVRVQAELVAASPAEPVGHAFNLGQHCPACTLHDLALGLPAAEVGFRAQPMPAGHAPVVQLAARDNRVALAAPARAPPQD